MLLLSMVSTSIFAIGNALPKGTMPENGKKYYIYADTKQSGDTYVARYLYDNNGTLATSTELNDSNEKFVWTCIQNSDETYSLQNNSGNYLANNGSYHISIGTTAAKYLFKNDAMHNGISIYNAATYNGGKYMVTKADGTAYNRNSTAINDGIWCSDYVFIPYTESTGNSMIISTNIPDAGSIIVNGTKKPLPYTIWESDFKAPYIITAEANGSYTFQGFYDGDTPVGEKLELETIEDQKSYEARFEAKSIFSTAENLVPVHIDSNRRNGYCIRMNSKENYNTVNSGSATYEENEIWYLVGNAEEFKMYNKLTGMNLALKLAGNGQDSPASLDAEGTALCLVAQEDGSYGICPVDAKGQSLNMHGGNGKDIKLYGINDSASKWLFSIVSSNPLTINYNTNTEGAYETNYKIGELTINLNGTTSTSMLEMNNLPTSSKLYFPEGSATFGMSVGNILRGWKMDINGDTSIENKEITESGLEVNVNITVDENNKYQYLYYSPGPGGHPYRIPAIATTANGYVFAINDFRPCGGDIGNGDVDLVMRHSTAAGSDWDGHSWTNEIKIVDGEGHEAHSRGETWKVGFGDPAVVADRENNEILVMSVCGNRLCWNGNYGAGTADNPENPNRIARTYIKFNEETQQWVIGQPEEVTYDIYPLFEDENKVHVGSMFIGAGRIAQSSKIKVGTHYRIYCAVWAVETGSSRYHNYAIYSDDFGKSWNVLGKLGWENCPAKYGNEPKCEELPDGSVLLSSRKGYGRYFNVFRYTDIENGKGEWMGEVSTDAVGDLEWGGNDTNGEPLRIGNVLFQSAPTGSGRSDVAVFYKILSNNPADYTPTALSNGWTKIAITDKESAYSSMCILPGREEIGFFYEEAPGGYSMVYVPLKLEDILSEEAYNATKQDEEPFAYNKGLLYTYINKFENAVSESKKEYFNALQLQASNADSCYYVSTNAQEDSEGPIANLVDGSNDTHFHSEYRTNVGEEHYIQVKLGEGNELSAFGFRYATRKAETNFPAVIDVYGSTDGTNFTKITTVKNLPTGNTSSSVIYTSDEIVCDEAYSYLRFTVTANNSGNKEAGGHYYFHMAEFCLLTATELPEELAVATEAANEAIAAAKSAFETAETAEEFEAAVKAIKDAYKAFLAATGNDTENEEDDDNDNDDKNEGDNDDESVIENIEAMKENVVIFDFTGRKVNSITASGIYIVNGKKVLIK